MKTSGRRLTEIAISLVGALVAGYSGLTETIDEIFVNLSPDSVYSTRYEYMFWSSSPLKNSRVSPLFVVLKTA